MTNKELFEKLFQLKLDTITARFSDDGGAIARDEKRYQDALASQSEFSDEEISNAVTSWWNEKVAKA